jgi:hypothetical protein
LTWLVNTRAILMLGLHIDVGQLLPVIFGNLRASSPSTFRCHNPHQFRVSAPFAHRVGADGLSDRSGNASSGIRRNPLDTLSVQQHLEQNFGI